MISRHLDESATAFWNGVHVDASSHTKQSLRGSRARTTLPAQLGRAPNPTAVGHIVDQLRDAIVRGALPPGSRLVEIELAERFAVSRGPVREALRVLHSQGLVTVRPNRGALVRALGADDVLEVYVLRAALGVAAIRQLVGAQLISSDVADDLRKLLEHARKRSSRSRQAETVESDLAFQSGIVEACGLPRIIARFQESTAEVMLFITSLQIEYPDTQRIINDNADLLAALLDSDSDRAVELWRGRMHTAVREFLELIPGGRELAEQRPWLWKML
jgi:DNA-binding GntR family transcriptional regulator